MSARNGLKSLEPARRSRNDIHKQNNYKTTELIDPIDSHKLADASDPCCAKPRIASRVRDQPKSEFHLQISRLPRQRNKVKWRAMVYLNSLKDASGWHDANGLGLVTILGVFVEL